VDVTENGVGIEIAAVGAMAAGNRHREVIEIIVELDRLFEQKFGSLIDLPGSEPLGLGNGRRIEELVGTGVLTLGLDWKLFGLRKADLHGNW
jgi:hypothetical protein